MKIVINGKCGGFRLSEEAEQLYRKKTGRDFYWTDDYSFRADPDLVAVIKKLGSERASGPHAKLEIVNVEDGKPFIISEYDGMESIEYAHDMEWLVGDRDCPALIREYLDRIVEAEANKKLQPNDCVKCRKPAVIKLVREIADFSDFRHPEYESGSHWQIRCTADSSHQMLADTVYACAVDWWNRDNPQINDCSKCGGAPKRNERIVDGVYRYEIFCSNKKCDGYVFDGGPSTVTIQRWNAANPAPPQNAQDQR